jgi:CheY-like chemotaxis protein
MTRPLIVVVDDDLGYLEFITMALEEAGYDVVTCTQKEEAYDVIRQKQPDLVLLDIRLRGTRDGWVLLDLLQLTPSTNTIPVIICSADAQFVHQKERRVRVKGHEVLVKPFALDDLESYIGRAINA